MPDSIIIGGDSEEVAGSVVSLVPRGIGLGLTSSIRDFQIGRRIEISKGPILDTESGLPFIPNFYSDSLPGLISSAVVAGEASLATRTSDFMASGPSRCPTPSSEFASDAHYLFTSQLGFDQLFRRAFIAREHHIPINTTLLFEQLDGSLRQGFRPLISSFQNHIMSTSAKMRQVLPWKVSQELQKTSADVVILKQIMFLLMNNFAGSDYAAFDAIFEQVKRFSISQMEEILDNIPDPYTSALQQSILTIAIKSNIPAIVEILLKRGLDANRVTCRFDGKAFTPLELACKFSRLEVVKILIQHRADPNRTASSGILVSSASALLIHGIRDAELSPDTCAILQCLLTAHVKISSFDLQDQNFWTNTSLVDIYVCFSEHPISFVAMDEVSVPLFNAMKFCNFPRATAAIKTMLGCELDRRFTAHQVGNVALQEVLWHASYQGNSELVEYLLLLGLHPDVGCLCEAVRGNNRHLFQKYIRTDISVHEMRYVKNQQTHYAGTLPPSIESQLLEGCYIMYDMTTPFAEAIRWRHQHLGEELQDMKTLEAIPDGYIFHLTVLAAAEAGNTDMIQRLLRFKEENHALKWSWASNCISVAMLGNHEEIVELLLQAGVLPDSNSVLSAVLVRNARLASLFLDAHFSIRPSERAVYFAVRWGNLDVLKKLIAVGFSANEIEMTEPHELEQLCLVSHPAGTWLSPLGEAIRLGNLSATQLLFETGAAISPPILSQRKSPLRIAIDSGDELIVRELLIRGADPDDPGALQAAVSQSMHMVNLILSAFLRRYSTGSKYFFDSTLRKAIRENKETVIWALIKHADLSDTGWWGLRSGGEEQLRQEPKHKPFAYRRLPTLLGESIDTRKENTVRILLDSGGDPNSIVEIDSELPQTGRLTAILKAISIGDLAIVKLLHRTGANLHLSARLRITRTSLQLAVELGHFEIVQFLLEQGVDVNAPPCIFVGGTALQFAAKTGSVGTAELLLQHGADINARGSRYQGRTAFEYAAEFGRMDMLLLLFHQGVDIVSDGGEQVRRACKFAERNGQIAAKSLVMQLAETKGLDVFPAGVYFNIGSGDNFDLSASEGNGLLRVAA